MTSIETCGIVTIDSTQHSVLSKKTQKIQLNELPLAKQIGEQLIKALQPYQPAAGLAAPQIGINKAVFIYSYDRDPKNLEVVINPEFSPHPDGRIEGWEGCLSVILGNGTWKVAKLPRYAKIDAVYTDIHGNKVTKTLEGFAAKVFQHEYDHLQGIVNIYHKDAVVKSFPTKEEMQSFMQAVKKEDATHYKQSSKT